MWTSIQTFLESLGERALQALPDLPTLLPYLLVVIALLIVLILARLFIVVLARKRVSDPAASGDDGESDASSDATSDAALSSIQTSFAAAMKRLRRLMQKRGYPFDWFARFTGYRYRYEVPWVAVVGEEDSGKTTLLDTLDLDQPVSSIQADENAQSAATGCNWWFYNQALVLDVPGQYLYRSEGHAMTNGWRRILKQLRLHRSRQPLNAIVLTIPCTDVLGKSALSTAEIETKASTIYTRLNELQKRLGLQLPVYVLLTKCDAVPGFQALCDDVPQDRWSDMLGWSNPYSVDAAYASDWLDEAFATIREDLHYAQLRALSDGLQTDAWDSIFLLPDLLEHAKGKLSTYMDTLFRQSAYDDSFSLRGVYLTGSPTATDAATNGLPGGGTPTPLFTKDLFQDKIFKEDALAQPLASAQGWQQRATQFVQAGVAALALLCVLGLWTAGDELGDERRNIHPTLQTAKTSITKAQQWRSRSRDASGQQASRGGQGASSGTSVGVERAFENMAPSLLRETAQASSVNLTSWLIPASWISGVEGQIDEAIAATYDQVILQAMRSGLRLRSETLMSGSLRSGQQAAAAADTLSLQALPAYQAWAGYVQDLSKLERAASQYTALTQRPNLDHFANVAQYLFDVRIRSSLRESPAVYREALASIEADPFPLSAYQEPATARMRQHARRFNTALPQQYGVRTRLQQLATQIDELGTASTDGGSETQQLHSVQQGITRVEGVLQAPSGRWVTSDTLALRTVYGSFLAYADTSALMTAGLVPDLRQSAQASIAQLQDNLRAVRSDMTGPLLKRTGGRIQREWTPQVTALRDAIGRLLNQAFMDTPTQPQPFRASVPNERRLDWGLQELQRVTQHIQTYDSLVTQGFSQFSPAMQRTIRRVASAGLRSHLMPHLARAQSFPLDAPSGGVSRQEAAVQMRADRFRKALDPLNTVLVIQRELGMDEAQRRLVQVTAQEAVALLEDVDLLLTEEDLYNVSPSAFAQWRGRRPPGLAVISARDSQEVSRYLTVQRERMTFLAQTLAGPALSFLNQWEQKLGSTDRALIDKWSGINQQLQKYQSKTAGNTLAVFEDYLTAATSDVTPVSYFLETPASLMGQRSSDFFLQKRNAFRRRLYERSRELAIERARTEYRTLSTFFNQEIAGTFPFASLDQNGSVPDAAPSTIRRLYRTYDAFASTYKPVLDSVGASTEVLRFLKHVRDVRSFFAATIDAPSTYPLPTVDVAPTFRVNRDREAAANQIIEWQMRVARESASHTASDTLHWAMGDPVEVRLRWASDAPSRPTDAQRGTVDEATKTVTYRYTGQWALLRLMRRHAGEPEDFPRRIDPNPYTLRFTATTEGDDVPQARAFLRLFVYRPDATERITTTAPFPRRAPTLSLGMP